jgi:hypothetical protein
MREQPVSDTHQQLGFGAAEIMLVHACGEDRAMGSFSRQGFRVRADPCPGFPLAEGSCAFRQAILHPDRFRAAARRDGAQTDELHCLLQDRLQAVQVPGRSLIGGDGEEHRLRRRAVRLIEVKGHAGRFAPARDGFHPVVDQQSRERLIESQRLRGRDLRDEREASPGNRLIGRAGQRHPSVLRGIGELPHLQLQACAIAHGFRIEHRGLHAHGARTDIGHTLKPGDGSQGVVGLERQARPEGFAQLCRIARDHARQRQEVCAEDDSQIGEVMIPAFFRGRTGGVEGTVGFGYALQPSPCFHCHRSRLRQEYRSCLRSRAADVHGHGAGHAERCELEQGCAQGIQIRLCTVTRGRVSRKQVLQRPVRSGERLQCLRHPPGELLGIKARCGG